MSKKRKTKKEKIASSVRREEETPVFETSPKTYSIQPQHKIEIEVIEDSTSNASLDKLVSIPQNIKKILIASGIIFASNIILFLLLQTFSIELGFLGY